MRSRSRRSLTVLLLVAIVALPPVAASANRIEPPVAYLWPAEFQQVPVSRGGVQVTYACPAYPSGDAGGYRVRFSNGDEREPNGRLTGGGQFGRYFVGEAPALPGSQPGTCISNLQLANAPIPAALYLGPLAWQVVRSCAGCEGGWEVGPLAWVSLVYNVEGAELSPPKHLYAGYLSRFTFHAISDLNGAEIALQGIGRKFGSGNWTDLDREPYESDGNTFFVKLPAGHHKLRVSLYSQGLSFGLPYLEATVKRPTGRRVTGVGDDGRYTSPSPVGANLAPATFEVIGEGKVLRGLRAPVTITCQGGAPGTSVVARLRSARVAPDGTVVGRAVSRGETPIYVTLEGTLRHRRFTGTLATSFQSCGGSRELNAIADQGPAMATGGSGPHGK